jgi:tRNA U38,U39,U40 pseudouridine synthase TruA
MAEADGFLYKMVRSLVGALVAAGAGKLTLQRSPHTWGPG